MANLLRRTDDYDSDDLTYGTSTFVFIILVLLAGSGAAALLLFRRRQRSMRNTTLPIHSRPGHHRTLTIATTPSASRGDAIFVYDEKMNLIANSHGPSDGPVPEIRVTFPEEEDLTGQRTTGRVVVLRISDTGSVGMEPLHQEQLPAYQRSDAQQFQSLDLESIGGLQEKPQPPNTRYS